MFAGKKLAQIREILISESTWEEMTCLFAPSLPQTRRGAKEEWRFRSERAEDKNHRLTIQYSQGSFITEVKSLRMQPCINGIYFEKNWPDFLNGEIYTQ